MKKYLFLAATALMFAACSNEELTSPDTGLAEVAEEGAVGFDIYLPQATQSTRSGRTNVMTTPTLKLTGFGVLGYWHDKTNDNATYQGDATAGTLKPDFMYNQQISFNTSSNGWYYSPLKYWPNETGVDSQTTPAEMPTWNGTTTDGAIDRLSFFAYAPWTRFNLTSGNGDPDPGINVGTYESHKEAPNVCGITNITKWDGTYMASTQGDPKIRYVVATDPNNSVDLLWGTAPVGGLSYTAVNGEPISIPEGKPLVDLVKPAVNTNLKFLFHHALARLGVKIVLAADQVAAGGDFDFGSTKVTVESIKLYGKADHSFGLSGDLNLKNTTANVPKWENVTPADKSTDDNVLTIEAGKGLAPHLVYDASLNTAHQQQVVTGVVTELADAIKVSSTKDYDSDENKYVKKVSNPAYTALTPFFDSYQGNFDWTTGASYNGFTYDITDDTGDLYFYMSNTSNILTDSKAVTIVKPSVTYPTALYWKNIYKVAKSSIIKVTDTNISTYGVAAYKDMAYRCIDKNLNSFNDETVYGATFYPTGQIPEIGDYVFTLTASEWVTHKADVPTVSADKYMPVPNYFMVIPTNYIGETDDDKTLYVKIKYWVSTKDPSIENGILYIPNEVEKEIVLPNFKNGMAYNLKIILGMTSVKLEAEMEEWQTMTQEVNLPQNISE